MVLRGHKEARHGREMSHRDYPVADQREVEAADYLLFAGRRTTIFRVAEATISDYEQNVNTAVAGA